MKNKNKNKIIIIIILSLLFLIMAFFIFKDNLISLFTQKDTNNNITYLDTVNKNSEENNNINNTVESLKGKIILGNKYGFEDLDSKGQEICHKYYKRFYNPEFDEKYEVEKCGIKYYDENIALIGLGDMRQEFILNIYDYKNDKVLSPENYLDRIDLYSGFIENERYLVSFGYIDDGNVRTNHILYFAPGMNKIFILPGSELKKQTETYLKSSSGFMDEFEISLDGDLLKVSVFEEDGNDDNINKKLREVEFKLP